MLNFEIDTRLEQDEEIILMPATRDDKLKLLEFCADNHYNVWTKENGELRVAIHFNYWGVLRS